MMKLHKMPFYGAIYQRFMKAAHRYNWHLMEPRHIDGELFRRCPWCGLRAEMRVAELSQAYRELCVIKGWKLPNEKPTLTVV